MQQIPTDSKIIIQLADGSYVGGNYSGMTGYGTTKVVAFACCFYTGDSADRVQIESYLGRHAGATIVVRK